MGADLTRLWICTLQERWGLISKLDGTCNPMLLDPDLRHFRQNAAKQVRSARKFTLPKRQAGCWSPGPWEAIFPRRQKCFCLVASPNQATGTKCHNYPEGAPLANSNRGTPLPHWAPSQAVPNTSTSFLWFLLGKRDGIFFSLFSIPLFFLFAFPLCPQGTEW